MTHPADSYMMDDATAAAALAYEDGETDIVVAFLATATDAQRIILADEMDATNRKNARAIRAARAY